MKKKFINIVLAIACMISISDAQTNLNFENWGPSNMGSFIPTGWTTFNMDLLGFPESTFQETANPGEGSSSVKMVNTSGYTPVFGYDIIGGVVFQSSPYTDKPVSVDFMYKSNILATDTGWFLVTLQHWDGIQSVVDAEAKMTFSGAPVTSWTTVSLPFQYYTSNTPDTISIMITSSNNVVPQPTAGSELQIDAIAFDTSAVDTSAASIDMPNTLNKHDELTLYPSPTNGIVEFKKDINEPVEISIFNYSGELVRVLFIERTKKLDISDLNKGLYLAKVKTSDKCYTQKIILH